MLCYALVPFIYSVLSCQIVYNLRIHLEYEVLNTIWVQNIRYSIHTRYSCVTTTDSGHAAVAPPYTHVTLKSAGSPGCVSLFLAAATAWSMSTILCPVAW